MCLSTACSTGAAARRVSISGACSHSSSSGSRREKCRTDANPMACKCSSPVSWAASPESSHTHQGGYWYSNNDMIVVVQVEDMNIAGIRDNSFGVV